PQIVSVIHTNNVPEDKSQNASLLLESINLSSSDLDDKQQAQLNQLLQDNHDVFALKDDELGQTSLVEHHIDTGNSRPIYRQPYRVSLQRTSIDNHVQEMLDQETDALPSDNKRARSFVLYGDKFYLDDNGLLFSLWTPSKRTQRDVCSQLVIPDALKHEVLVCAHDDVNADHLGTQKTYGKIPTRYYWRNMFWDIDRWRNSCVDCAMKKSPRNRHKAPLLPIPVENAFDRLAVDCLGPFPLSDAGNRYVVIFTEYLT
ncbi:Hypothetical predicted protein, partial [Paramuricea clavata]